MEEVSGIDELKARYAEDILVELRPTLRDGKPAALKVRQLRPVVFLALGRGMPVPTHSKSREPDSEEAKEQFDYMRRVVAASIVAVREAVMNGTGTWETRWTPVNVLVDRQPVEGAEPRQLRIDDLDFLDTVPRVWNAIFSDIDRGGGYGGAAVGFRSGGASVSGSGGENVQPDATRVRVRKTRQAR